MTDASLPRLLRAQLPPDQQVGLVPHAVVTRGQAAVRARLAELCAAGVRYAVVDALDNDDLRTLAVACDELPLVTGASGLALGLRPVGDAAQAAALPECTGPAAIVSGSCSQATQGQVAHWQAGGRRSFRIDALRCTESGAAMAREAVAWAASHLAQGPVLVYATSTPAEVRAVQERWGVERAGAAVEACLARVARGLVDMGVRRLVVAGGETSGAVVQELGISQLRIGPTIAPGVPWTWAAHPGLRLALKSGNFGAADFFERAVLG